jgi:hypothetical protein
MSNYVVVETDVPNYVRLSMSNPPSRWLITCSADAIPPDQTYATEDAANDVIRLHSAGCPGEHAVLLRPAFGESASQESRDSRA